MSFVPLQVKIGVDLDDLHIFKIGFKNGLGLGSGNGLGNCLWKALGKRASNNDIIVP